jgi:hypothetical protein
MRKTLFVLAMVALITLVAATPALAGRGGPSGDRNGGSSQRQPSAVAGAVADIGENTIAVQVVDGHRPSRGISPHSAAGDSSTHYACAQGKLLRSLKTPNHCHGECCMGLRCSKGMSQRPEPSAQDCLGCVSFFP